MKIQDRGTKLDRPPKTAYLDNDDISVRWNAEEQVLEILALSNPHRYKKTRGYETRYFHCVVQLTLDDIHRILSCLGSDVVVQSGDLLAQHLSSCSRALLRLLLSSSGLAATPSTHQ